MLSSTCWLLPTTLFMFSLSFPCFSQTIDTPAKEMLAVETYSKTKPYSELVNIDVQKTPFDNKTSQEIYCLNVRDRFNYDLSSEQGEINSVLEDIMNYRDAVATMISTCSGSTKEVPVCTNAQLKEAFDFSRWYFKNIHFMENLSCVLNTTTVFGPYDQNREHSEQQINKGNLDGIAAATKYNATIVASINDHIKKMNNPAPQQKQANNLLFALSAFDTCEQKIKALDPNGTNPFSAYISQYRTDIGGELYTGFLNNFDGKTMLGNYEAALGYYANNKNFNEETKQLKDVCVGLASTAKNRLVALQKVHNKEINEHNAQAIADFFNPYINLISARCELIHANATELKAKTISPENNMIEKQADFLDAWENSSTTSGRNVGYGARGDDLVQIDSKVKAALDAYAQTPFVKGTQDLFNAIFSVPEIQFDKKDPSTKMPNPLYRLLASKTLNSKMGFAFIVKNGFLNVCMRYGSPFSAGGLSGPQRQQLGKMPMISTEAYLAYKADLKQSVKNASEGKDTYALFTGPLVLTAKDEVNKLLKQAIDKADNDIDMCLTGPGEKNPTNYISADISARTDITDHERRELEYKVKTKEIIESEVFPTVIKEANEKRKNIISRYLTTAPMLAIEYIKNAPTAGDFDALCASLLASYSNVESRETIGAAVDIAIFVSFVLSYGSSTYVTIPLRTVLVAAGIVDGVISVKIVSEMNKEVSTIKEMQAAGFIDYEEGNKMIELANSQIGGAGLSLILDSVFIYSGLKGLKLLPIKRGSPKVPGEPVTDPKVVDMVAEKTPQEDIIKKGTDGQYELNLGKPDKIESPLPKQFRYKRLDKTSVDKYKKVLASRLRNVGVKVSEDDKLLGFFSKRCAAFNNFCRQMRFCKASYPSTKAWWALAGVGSVIRGGSTYYGYKKNLKKKKFNPYNFGSDVGSGLAKEWLYSYFIVKNTVDANAKGNGNNFNYKVSFKDAIKGWGTKFGKTYGKTFGWGLGAESLSNVGYYFTGGAEDEYGADEKLQATLVRTVWGATWVAFVAVPLKMTIYEMVVGLTCMIPGMKIFSKVSGITGKVVSVVLSYGAQAGYAGITSDYYYQGRNFMFDLFSIETLDEKEKKKTCEVGDEKDVEGMPITPLYFGDGDNAIEIKLMESGVPKLTPEEERNGDIMYQLIQGDEDGNLDEEPIIDN